MMVSLVPCGVRECRQTVIDRERERERQGHHKQEKEGTKEGQYNDRIRTHQGLPPGVQRSAGRRGRTLLRAVRTGARARVRVRVISAGPCGLARRAPRPNHGHGLAGAACGGGGWLVGGVGLHHVCGAHTHPPPRRLWWRSGSGGRDR
jgi:hypothetical protein